MVVRSIGCFVVVAAAVQMAAPGSAAAQDAADACAALGSAGAAVQALAGDDAAGADALCGLFAATEQRLADAEARVAELSAAPSPEPDPASELPPGAILLVDSNRGCPAGWTDVAIAEPEVFAGRTPVAAGFVEGQEVFRGFRELGGAEAVVLEEANLPPHAHRLPLAFQSARGAAGGRGGSGLASGSGFSGGGSFGDQIAVRTFAGRERTESAGAALPVETMPPFIALYWCRQD